MPTYKQAAAVVIIVMIMQVIALKFSLYYAWPSLDVPMHYLGGLAAGLVALAWWGRDIESITFTKKAWLSTAIFQWCVVLGFVAVVGIAWEWMEFGLDHIAGIREKIGASQTSLSDTMGDLFFDLLGATVAFLSTKLTGRKKSS